MKAIILAAGLSKRLRPITDTIPKCLIKIDGKTLIKRNVQNLLESGITSITVVVGYLQELIKLQLQKEFEKDINKISVVENRDFAATGSGYSLYRGLTTSFVEDDVMFMDADIIIHPLIIKDILNVPYHSFLYVGQNMCDEEAVKVYVDECKIVKGLTKQIDNTYSCLGESIGIVKIGARDLGGIVSHMQTLIDKGNRQFEWEELFDNNQTISLNTVTTSLPWTEIDYKSDIKSAQKVSRMI